MLQYPVQLPPLSLSSSRHSKYAPPLSQPSRDVSDDPRSAHGLLTISTASTLPPPTSGSLINPKRTPNLTILHDKPQHLRQNPVSPYFSHPHPVPLSISTVPHRTASPASSPNPPSPALTTPSPISKPIPVPPSPSLYSAKPIPRSSPRLAPRQLPSPNIAARQLPGSPVLGPRAQLVSPTLATRSPHPLKSSNLPLPSILDDEPSIVAIYSPTASRPTTGTRPSTAATARLSRAGTATRPTSAVRSVTYSSSQRSSGSQASASSLANVLFPGDLVGEGLTLQGELIRRVPITPQSSAASTLSHGDDSFDENILEDRGGVPAKEFEVVRKLGTGSYAVVYLVREVLSRSFLSPGSSEDGHGVAAAGKMDMGEDSLLGRDKQGVSGHVYGKEYAIKVLSKANLDEDALEAQLFEATIHQTLRSHSNIVTLHRTLESPSFLLLLLEFVPGEDLFYFLEQSRDHFTPPAPSPSTSPTSSSIEEGSPSPSVSGQTPPTPSLLSSLHPTHLLSQTRLKLIASMFGQMCDAVAACHEQSVFHRDIKPENFIVTDGWVEKDGVDGKEKIQERRVVVKLTDFGLGTMEHESADMDCGSAPYMSFECRNNVHPTYSPRAADVWSLGIVLINMLYHCNPWSDTTQGVCPAFESYLSQPVQFFMTRFTGLTYAVAEFLATRVFCILEDPRDDSPRISAQEFGRWVKDLPSLLGGHERVGHARNLSLSSTVGYTLASAPASRRPSVRHQHASEVRGSWVMGSSSRAPSHSTRASWALSQNPSFGVGPIADTLSESLMEAPVLPPVLDQDAEFEGESQVSADFLAQDTIEDPAPEQEPDSRCASTQKRRKRGARKGKGAASSSLAPSPAGPIAKDDTLNTLAEASQALAREISRTSKSSALQVLGLSSSSAQASPHSLPLVSPSTPPAAATPIAKKPSKWRLGFGKGNQPEKPSAAAIAQAAKVAPVPEAPSTPPSLVSLQSLGIPNDVPPKPSAVAHNVTSLLMGLNAPVVEPLPKGWQPPDDQTARGRARRQRATGAPLYSGSNAGSTWGPSSASSAFGVTGPYGHFHSNESNASWSTTASSNAIPNGQPQQQPRNLSPTSTRSGRPLASSASSMASNTSNWRSSMSSTNTANSSTSAFTRYSNGSTRSVATAATSVSSASSWRSKGSQQYPNYDSLLPGQLPPNIKAITGTPWELHEMPRHLNPEDPKTGPHPRKRNPQKESKLDSMKKLDTISEWPHQKSPLGRGAGSRVDASTSTTDLVGRDKDGGPNEDEAGSTPRKVQKGQINALAKMLSALRR